jgi:hypothetical protein
MPRRLAKFECLATQEVVATPEARRRQRRRALKNHLIRGLGTPAGRHRFWLLLLGLFDFLFVTVVAFGHIDILV